MLRNQFSKLLVLALSAAMLLAMALPSAAQDVRQDGLVNVNLGDVTAQLPIAIAANVCDVAVNVLAEQVRTGNTRCDSVAESGATVPFRGERGNVRQDGLVNVNAGDIIIQAPIGVAANICDVAVNVLAQQTRTGTATCNAVTTPTAG